MRGAAPMNVGFTMPEVVDDLVDPAVDRGGEAAGELGGEQHLAERVRHRQPQELQVVLVEDVLDLDRGALVDPRPVQQPHALGAAGGAGGVDQRRELVGGDRPRGLLDDARVLGEVGLAELGEVVEADDPVAVRRTVEGDDLGQVRQLVAVLLELGDLLVVLREHDPGLGVAEDVRRVLGVRRRVDGRRGARRTHHGQVGEDPLVARAGRDADALLGLDPEGEQARREPLHQVPGLPPGHRLPGLTARVAERLVVRRLLDPVEELHGEVRARGGRRSWCPGSSWWALLQAAERERGCGVT